MAAYRWQEGNHGRIKICGKRLEWQVFGPSPEEAPTIIMLHEGLGCVKMWRDFPQKLAEASGLGVFTYSRAGYGWSDPVRLPRPLDYMEREALETLPVLFHRTGIQDHILLGHSDGASIASIYAGDTHDEHLHGLVLLAPHFFTEPEGLASIRQAKTSFELGGLSGKLAKYHKHPQIAFKGWNEAWLDHRFEDWDITDTISRWNVPALVIQGRDDEYGTRQQIDVVERNATAPLNVVMMDECGHQPHIDHKATVLEITARFCTSAFKQNGDSVNLQFA